MRVTRGLGVSCSKVPQIPPNFICPNYLSKPKSSKFWWKKDSLGVRSPCMRPYLTLSEKEDCTFWYCFAILVGKSAIFLKAAKSWQKNHIFFFLFSMPFNCALFQLFPIYNTYFFLKVKCRISSKSLHKWDIFWLKKTHFSG